jgi:hypothetical protein
VSVRETELPFYIDVVSTGKILIRLSTVTLAITRCRNCLEIYRISDLLEDLSLTGFKRRIEEENVHENKNRTIQEIPSNAGYWNFRSLKAIVRLSPASIQNIWKVHKLKPYRFHNSELSQHPKSIEKHRDVAKFYLCSQGHNLEINIEDNIQIQVMDHNKFGLPLKRGRVGTTTYAHKLNRITSLFAALDTLDSNVIDTCLLYHHQKFLKYLSTINHQNYLGSDSKHIVGNYITYMHPKVIVRLDEHSHFHLCITFILTLWLDMVVRKLWEITNSGFVKAFT